MNDLFIIALIAAGVVQIITLCWLYDWDIMKMLYKEEVIDMKKAQSLDELSVGQTIYVESGSDTKEYVIASIEDKLVPYIVATDNSSHSLRSGIWIVDQ